MAVIQLVPIVPCALNIKDLYFYKEQPFLK